MTCHDARDVMSAAVDGELEHHLLPLFSQHIEECRSCKNEYELERLTKDVVRKTLHRTTAPSTVVASIRQVLAQEANASQSAVRMIFPRPARLGWAMLGSVAAIALLYIIFNVPKSHHSHAQPQDANIVHQTYNNFDGVLQGKFKPQVASDNPQVVQSYYKSKCGCDVKVPWLKDCKLVGCFHEDGNHGHIAELMYTHNDDPVYILEAKLRDVVDGSKLQIPPEILQQLQQTGWYIDDRHPNCTLIIKLVDSTICCTVADINKDQLLASLK